MEALEYAAKVAEYQEREKTILNILRELENYENPTERRDKLRIKFFSLQDKNIVLKEELEADDGK